MSNKIEYTITFYSDWQTGSGLSGGAELDDLCIKDENGLPFIPGKTLKGLFLDAFKDYNDFKKVVLKQESIFGLELNKEKKQIEQSKEGLAKNTEVFFSDAVIREDERKEIISNGLQKFLFRKMASTAINKSGIAEQFSLRTLEVCMPVILTATIENVNENSIETLENVAKLIRSVGGNRNRGLGRCKLKINKP
jgi:CRISPR/Cas system CSM-associated protein Csm3 (group 7 of RAMP superfamily)